MLSIREQILQKIVATLETATETPVERNRDAPVQVFPYLVVRDGSQEAQYINSNRVDYRMTVQVEGFVKAALSHQVGSALNALYASTVKALISDYTLGGLSEDVTETTMDILIDDLPGNSPHGAFQVTFQITYATRESDPYTLAP